MFLLLVLGVGSGLFLYYHLRKAAQEGICSGCSRQGKGACPYRKGANSTCQ